MYKIKKVENHYEIFDESDVGDIEVHLASNSEVELKGKIRMICEDIGISKDIYNQAINDAVNKLKERNKDEKEI